MTKRTRMFTVRMTLKEYESLKKKASSAGLKMEPFVRRLIEEWAVQPKPQKQTKTGPNEFR